MPLERGDIQLHGEAIAHQQQDGCRDLMTLAVWRESANDGGLLVNPTLECFDTLRQTAPEPVKSKRIIRKIDEDIAVDGSAGLSQLGQLLQHFAETVRVIAQFEQRERSALDMIANQLEGIGDRLGLLAARLRRSRT